MTITNSLRFCEDFTNAVDCLLSQNQKPTYIIYVSGDVTNFNDPVNQKVIVRSRLTIADGYRAWTASQIHGLDGYLYPRVEQLKGQALVLAGGQLTDKLFTIGSFTLPYVWNTNNYGLDPLSTFQPAPNNNNNIEVYIQVFGLGLPNSVNYFKVKDVVLSGKGIQEGISYKVLCEQTDFSIDIA